MVDAVVVAVLTLVSLASLIFLVIFPFVWVLDSLPNLSEPDWAEIAFRSVIWIISSSICSGILWGIWNWK